VYLRPERVEIRPHNPAPDRMFLFLMDSRLPSAGAVQNLACQCLLNLGQEGAVASAHVLQHLCDRPILTLRHLF
jgi:hypothetical protein